MSTITDLQQAIGHAVERVGPAVVGFGRGWGRGSGVVVAPGRVLTTAHNLRGDEVTVNLPGRAARDRARWPASTPTSTSPRSRSTPATSSRSSGTRPRRAGHRHAGDRARRTPAGAACARRPGFVSSEGREHPRSARAHDRRLHRAHRSASARLRRRAAGRPRRAPAGAERGPPRRRPDRRDPGRRAPRRARASACGAASSARPVRLGVAIAPPRVARRLRRAVGLPERDGVLVRSVARAQPGRGAPASSAAT